MFVVRRKDTGEYLMVGPTWSRKFTPDLQEARTYNGRGPAKNSASSCGPYYRKVRPYEFEVVPVVIALG